MASVAEDLLEVGTKIRQLGKELDHLQPELAKVHHEVELGNLALQKIHDGVQVIVHLETFAAGVITQLNTESKLAHESLAKLQSSVHDGGDQIRSEIQALDQHLHQVADQVNSEIGKVTEEAHARTEELHRLNASWQQFQHESDQLEQHLLQELATFGSTVDDFVHKLEQQQQHLDQSVLGLEQLIDGHLHEVSASFEHLISEGQNQLHHLTEALGQLAEHTTANVSHEFIDQALQHLHTDGQALIHSMRQFPHQLDVRSQQFEHIVHQIADVIHQIGQIVEAIKPVVDLIEAF